jgi:hypothetical protein
VAPDRHLYEGDALGSPAAMSGHRIAGMLGAAAAAAALAAAPALGAGADRQRFSAHFTAHRPATPTGDVFRLVVRDPSDPSAKPPRVTRIVSIAPHGSVTRPQALPHCSASDAELALLGGSACPSGSLDATGRASFVTGFGAPTDPLMFDLQDYYDGHGLDVVAAPRGASAPHFVSHTTFTGPGGERAVTDFAPLPGGPPDGHSALQRTTLRAPRHGRFFTTPRTCPRSGHWTFRVRVTYADGVTQRSSSRSRCVGRRDRGR